MGTGLLEGGSTFSAQRLDIMKQMAPFAEEKLLLLKPPGKCWQPTDFLPDSTSENWHDEVKALRKTSESLSDELLVVLIGDMITEEALPSYQTMLTATDGFLEGLAWYAYESLGAVGPGMDRRGEPPRRPPQPLPLPDRTGKHEIDRGDRPLPDPKRL